MRLAHHCESKSLGQCPETDFSSNPPSRQTDNGDAYRRIAEREISRNEYTSRLDAVLPSQMLYATQWMRCELRQGNNGKWGMVPQASGHSADSTDRRNWRTFERAAHSHALDDRLGAFTQGRGLQFMRQ